MSQQKRILIAVVIVVLIVGSVLGIEAWRRSRMAPDLPPGSIPIYVNGDLVAVFTPEDLQDLEQTSFVDEEEGKTQEGWLLREVLEIHLEDDVLQPETEIVVSSSSREKSARLTWPEVRDPENWVMFDLSGRGTLKLVSVLERLDIRDEWIQDVDKIEVETP